MAFVAPLPAPRLAPGAPKVASGASCTAAIARPAIASRTLRSAFFSGAAATGRSFAVSPLVGTVQNAGAIHMAKKVSGKAAKRASGGGGGGGGSEMSRKYIYEMYKMSKVLPGGKDVLKNINLCFYPGAKIGVIGSNGSGKSTLLKIMAGLDDEVQGTAKPLPGTKIGYLAQEPELTAGKTVLENILPAVEDVKALLRRFEEVSLKLGEPMSDEEMEKVSSEFARLQDEIEAKNGWEIDRTLEMAMEALRCPPPDADVSVISGGEKRRVALCRLLLENNDMLLLDEPTNHLDAESVAWLEKFLQVRILPRRPLRRRRDFKGTVVTITHDRYFLDNVAGWILELDRGQGIPWQGNYSRSTNIPPGPRLGDRVISFEGVSKSFGERLLYEGVTFDVPSGGIVGIIGGNGAGKTTLFKMIAGLDKPDSGDIEIGQTVKLMYVDQQRTGLEADETVWQSISGGNDEIKLGARTLNSRAYCSLYGFRGGDQQKKAGVLSGGERNRLNLARVLKSGGNVLMLDEPTNDLDVDTLRALEDGLEGFGGCALIISHDRWFLNRIATHILAFEDDGNVVFYPGNFDEYEADRRKRLGNVEPKRIKYRPLATH
eukprot:tig00000194_g14815.t1